jgi:membrane-associated HD superfamily phosphohydrolase
MKQFSFFRISIIMWPSILGILCCLASVVFLPDLFSEWPEAGWIPKFRFFIIVAFLGFLNIFFGVTAWQTKNSLSMSHHHLFRNVGISIFSGTLIFLLLYVIYGRSLKLWEYDLGYMAMVFGIAFVAAILFWILYISLMVFLFKQRSRWSFILPQQCVFIGSVFLFGYMVGQSGCILCVMPSLP